MKALIVIDMQDDYVGENQNKKRYHYDSKQLISNINSKIAAYEKHNDLIIYVKNKRKSENVSEFVPELRLASDNIFVKNKASCFSNSSLLTCLTDKSVNEIELIGVDGNYCVGMSALEGKKLGFSIYFPLSCIGIANTRRFDITRKKLLEANIYVSV